MQAGLLAAGAEDDDEPMEAALDMGVQAGLLAAGADDDCPMEAGLGMGVQTADLVNEATGGAM